MGGLNTIADGIPNSEEAYNVLLSTGKGEVELSQLHRGQTRVFTTDRRGLLAAPLKAIWLDGSDDCEAACCSAVAQPAVLKPAPTPTAQKAPSMASQPHLAKSTKVKVHGVLHASMTHFNGKLGTIDSYHVHIKAYLVTFDDGSSQAIPGANLQVQPPPATAAASPAAAAAPGGATQTFGNISNCENVVTGGTNKFVRYGNIDRFMLAGAIQIINIHTHGDDAQVGPHVTSIINKDR